MTDETVCGNVERMDDRPLYTSLAYAGAIPFIFAALLPWFGIDELGWIGPIEGVAISYGLAIASFLAGAHWGTYLYRRTDTPINLFITSNAAVLAAWFAVLLGSPLVALLVLALTFVSLLAVDYRLKGSGLLTGDYLRMRTLVTTVVVACLLSNTATL